MTEKLTKQDLINWLAQGETPLANAKIGVEHEKFCFVPDSQNPYKFSPIAYDGDNGIQALLTRIAEIQQAQTITEDGKLIGLKYNGASVTLEPAGQLELSGAPLQCLHQCHDELMHHFHHTRVVGQELGIHMVGMGFHPTAERDSMNWMPKGRYQIMKRYMQQVGNLGLDMMTRTCTVQVNLDYQSEQDMIQKMRIAMALQPMVTALFANSPLMHGKPNGYQSYRSHIWTDTDPDRCGILNFVFDDNFGYERWVDYVLDVPMYFINRGGEYCDVAGKSFRDFMNGQLDGFIGETPTWQDWEDHCTTNFPEVRLKQFIEMRGADAGCRDSLMALPALWVGLLYNPDVQQKCADLIADWTVSDISAMRDNVPQQGLSTPSPMGTLLDVARAVVPLARHGLKTRPTDFAHEKHADTLCESKYLHWLETVVDSGQTSADKILSQTAKDPTLSFLFKDGCF